MAVIQQILLTAGAVARTYATWNPSDKSAGITLSGGNLTGSIAAFASGGVRATLSKNAGKWQWENVLTNTGGSTRVGGANSSWLLSTAVGSDTNSVGYQLANGMVYNNAGSIATLSSAVAGDVIGIGLDMDNNLLSFYKNGTIMGSAITIPAGTYFPAWSVPSSVSAVSITTNFGATALAYPIAGFNAGLYI